MRHIIVFALFIVGILATQSPEKAIAAYAELAYDTYTQAVHGAEAMRSEVDALVEAPSAERLAQARRAWTTARRAYGRSEVFRFCGGPIDGAAGVELYINAWPIDEAFLDAVRDSPEGGIIQNPELYPTLDGTLLSRLNEAGSKTHVATGWHAIEFILWGQDFYADGPGRRSHLDFVTGERPHAARRRTYLKAVAAQLVEHLSQVRAAWTPGADNYRAAFLEEDSEVALGKMLGGAAILSGFEMAGQRIAAAHQTRDQGDEHSRFSDTTHLDLLANQRGVEQVWGTLRTYVREAAPGVAADIRSALAASRDALEAIPTPFDQAILGDDDAPGRQALLAATEALEHQASRFAELGVALDVRVRMRPGK